MKKATCAHSYKIFLIEAIPIIVRLQPACVRPRGLAAGTPVQRQTHEGVGKSGARHSEGKAQYCRLMGRG